MRCQFAISASKVPTSLHGTRSRDPGTFSTRSSGSSRNLISRRALLFFGSTARMRTRSDGPWSDCRYAHSSPTVKREGSILIQPSFG
jgi:hypothetical protein